MSNFITGLVGLGTGLAAGALLEPADTAYARQPLQIAGVPGKMGVNANLITFGPTIALWGTLTTFAIYDLGGNLAWTGTLAAPVTPPVATPLVFLPGQLSITLP